MGDSKRKADEDVTSTTELSEKKRKTSVDSETEVVADTSAPDSVCRKKHSKKKSKKSKSKHEKKHRHHKCTRHKHERKESKSQEAAKDEGSIGPEVPGALADVSKQRAPITKEEHEKNQVVVRRVFDEETGRHRLVKGDGEIIEEIVSKAQHKEINKTATACNAAYFAETIKKIE